jgi:hypothetical protein
MNVPCLRIISPRSMTPVVISSLPSARLTAGQLTDAASRCAYARIYELLWLALFGSISENDCLMAKPSAFSAFRNSAHTPHRRAVT